MNQYFRVVQEGVIVGSTSRETPGLSRQREKGTGDRGQGVGNGKDNVQGAVQYVHRRGVWSGSYRAVPYTLPPLASLTATLS